jgi:pimeloyl-ACP methyl ester carboxylesterase/UDP:flavonoid glycosyltransferase YjiC (YdhE family)
MRPCRPDTSGYVVNDGVRVYYETYGETGRPTLLLMPTWAIVHSRFWKMQVPYLARHFRVVTFDPRGNGRTDRPEDPAAYGQEAIAADAVAVLDATGTDAAVVLAWCNGTIWSMLMAQSQPERVLGLVAIATNLPLTPRHPARQEFSFRDRLDTEDGWAKENRHYWKRDWPGYVEFFTARMTTEAHSTKVYDDAVSWGKETDARTMLTEAAADAGPVGAATLERREQMCRDLGIPVLAICGDRDEIVPPDNTRRFAELTGADLLVIEGAGHVPHARHPVVVNQAVRAFVDRVVPPPPRRTPWLFARERRQKALWVSSPIGLGHVLRDLAIARAVREQLPGLQIEWLAQDPVTQVLEQAGEIVHPASADLASESAHWESEATGHDLHAFHAFRRLDETFCANYMLFDEVVRETPYDLWVGDESWEVDHFLHENPDHKRAPYVFTTDVVGFLPVDPQNDPREVELAADYNAEMIEHRERFPYVRDLSLFIGSWRELPDASFGPGLPGIREWTSRWFDTVPYVVPFDAGAYRDPAALRRDLGYEPGHPLLAVAVGGTAVGHGLLELVAEGFAHLRKEVTDARMVMVTGPRIDPHDVADVEGLTKHGFLDNAFAHLAAADAAVVQGGLSTTMELVAAGRPFLYFPLARHWEQQHFVTHRLDHYRAGTRMDFASTTPASLAAAMRTAMGRRPRYRAVPSDGAAVAGRRIARLLTGAR